MKITVLASAALVVLTLARQDQTTSPDLVPRFAPGGVQGPPWDVAVTRSGRFVVITNEGSGNLSIFGVSHLASLLRHKG